MVLLSGDDVWMVELDGSCGLGALPRRRRRSAEERWRVVEETFEVGASVVRVALKHGVNANQVFQWRRLYRDGKLGAAPEGAMKLLPVRVAEEDKLRHAQANRMDGTSSGSIHIELPGAVRISVEGSVDAVVVRAVLESLRS